jgi:hypothetical protein
MAHDELGCQLGDHVRIVESRPISRHKRWVVEEILRKDIVAAAEAELDESSFGEPELDAEAELSESSIGEPKLDAEAELGESSIGEPELDAEAEA